MYYYDYTLRKTKLPVFISQYREVLDKFTKHVDSYAETMFHYEPEHGLHVHGVIKSRRKIYINKIHPGKGFNLMFRTLPEQEVKRWIKYMSKHMKNEIILMRLEADKEHKYILSQIPTKANLDFSKLASKNCLVTPLMNTIKCPPRTSLTYPVFDIRKCKHS